MPKVSESALRETEIALGQYQAEIGQSPLAKSSQITHYNQARLFVLWLFINTA